MENAERWVTKYYRVVLLVIRPSSTQILINRFGNATGSGWWSTGKTVVTVDDPRRKSFGLRTRLVVTASALRRSR